MSNSTLKNSSDSYPLPVECSLEIPCNEKKHSSDDASSSSLSASGPVLNQGYVATARSMLASTTISRYSCFDKATAASGHQARFKSLEQSRRDFLFGTQQRQGFGHINPRIWNTLSTALGIPDYTPNGISFRINIQWIKKHFAELMKPAIKIPFLYLSIMAVVEDGKFYVMMDYTGNIVAAVDPNFMMAFGKYMTHGTCIVIRNSKVVGLNNAPVLVIKLSNVCGIITPKLFLQSDVRLLRQWQQKMNMASLTWLVTDKGDLNVLRLVAPNLSDVIKEVDQFTREILKAQTTSKIKENQTRPAYRSIAGESSNHLPVPGPLKLKPKPLSPPSENMRGMLQMIKNRTTNCNKKRRIEHCKNVLPKQPPIHKFLMIKRLESSVKKAALIFQQTLPLLIRFGQASTSNNSITIRPKVLPTATPPHQSPLVAALSDTFGIYGPGPKKTSSRSNT